MFRKLIKNTFIALLLLSYVASAISMEQPKPSLFSSKTKKILSDIAPYFTYKKNFIGVQLGIIAAYETLSLLDCGSSSLSELDFMDSSKLYPSILKKDEF